MRLVIFILTLLILLPFVSAEIHIDPLSEQKYNLGDSMIINGYILMKEPKQGILKVNGNCESGTVSLFVKTFMTLNANEKEFFSKTKDITSGEGNCIIKASFEDFNNNIIEESTASTFRITKDLDGNFNLVDTKIKLGDYLNISGTVFKLNGVNVGGSAIISLKKDNLTYYEDGLDITNGEFKYNLMVESLPSGRYTIEVFITDSNGNEELFNIGVFEVDNRFIIAGEVDKYNAKPGDTIEVKGIITGFDDEIIKVADVILEMENASRYDVLLKDGKFSQQVKLSETIKSGENDIKITASDEHGNYGEKIINVIVEAIPTRLNMQLNSISFNPLEKIEVRPLLYDQAGDIIFDKKINVKIIDSKKNNVFSKFVLNNEINELELDRFALPGVWKIIVEYDTFKVEKEISVNELVELDVSLDGQVIIVKNIGNVNYDGYIKLRLNDIEKDKKIDLNPNENKSIDLVREVDNGVYSVGVLANNKEIDLGNITIVDTRSATNILTGGVVGVGETLSEKWVYISIIIIVVIILLYFWLRFRGRIRDDYTRKRDKKEGMEKVKRVMGERARSKPRRLFFGSEIKEEDAKAFRESVLKTIEEDKEKKSPIFKEEKGEEGYRHIRPR